MFAQCTGRKHHNPNTECRHDVGSDVWGLTVPDQGGGGGRVDALLHKVQ